MKPSVGSIVLLVGFLSGCGGKHANAPVAPLPTLEILRDGLQEPSALAIDAPETYLVAVGDSDGKGSMMRFHREKSETFFPGFGRPAAMEFDFRDGRLFVGEGGAVRIYRMGAMGFSSKKIADPPEIFLFDGARAIGSISYSEMNNRAYLADPEAKRIWSLHPKKRTMEELIGPERFEEFGAGGPVHLRVSTDGQRIYLVLWKEPAESTLAVLHLKGRRLESLRSFPGVSFAGLGYYRSHFLLADRATGEIHSVAVKDRSVERIPPPTGWKGPAVAFGMDLQRAVFLERVENEGAGRLVRYNLNIKE